MSSTDDRAARPRTVLITGAASGIGAAVAEAFAREGARLALADRDAERLAALRDRLTGAAAVTTHTVDVADAGQVAAAVEEVVRWHGGVDVLVNSAGILTEVPLVEMDPTVWDETIAVDLRGVFLSCRYALPHMIEGGGGRIINIASQLGQKGGEGLTHYSAAKAGVIGFTKALAREAAPHHVLVNAIAPGPVETPLVDGLSADWKRAKQAELPLGRFGRPEEIAPTVLLLASDPGGNLYVGQTLGPNSGDVML
ncbi:SDR family NAD(P)-dependent oxidoreductase [Streptomyces paludis]|uniref:SDR family NAD(P)-dependent oxidoreductase n=1 Tax=Streptomyces paludis TaxID=2282738 RepID=A0A345HXQ3_9ACTN|nr:SDR family NAD(P)-dependent oxidoreductase [Streptomyces paludis]AXG81477.1 SDR family NAD(P)-dependent oxidoreductase [Streptomyces paludis]